MTRSRYIVGIDLGTTNCAVAYVDTKGRERPTADIRMFEVPQLVAPGETAPRSMLPSFLYLPGGHELPPGAARLALERGGRPDRRRVRADPGGAGPRPAGLAAPRAGSVTPASTARPTSCPGAAPPEVTKVSPVEASAAYLRHIRDAWNHAFAARRLDPPARAARGRADRPRLVRRGGPRADARGRQAGRARLDHAAGGAAGGVLLLDRLAPGPLAARGPRRRADPGLRHRRRHDRLQPDHGRRDADRARVPPRGRRRPPDARRRQHRPGAGPPRREEARRRPARHRAVERAAVRLPDGQGEAARRAAAAARALAGDDRRAGLADHRRQHPVRADAATRSRPSRSTASSPRSRAARSPERGARSGLQEFGLPFVADPAVPKHLSAFLRRHRAEAIGQGGHQPEDRPARPDAILFNGGALTPESVRRPDRRGDRLVVRRRPRPALCAARPHQRLARPGRGPGGGLLRSRPPRRRHPDRRRHGAVVLRRARDRAGGQALALRRPARRPGRRRDRDRRPRLRPPDGPAGRLPAGQQLGPARRQAGRPGGRRSRLDPRASAARRA